MKKIILLLVLLTSTAMFFSGCAVITNILDPLPEEYVEGVKVPRDYPDDDFEVYDDAVVFEAEEDDEEISLKYGTEDDIDDVIDFYEELFEDNELTVDEQEDDKDEFYAKGKGDGFKFEINAEEASGNYEERAFATVVEVDIEFYTVGEETLEKMKGFWHACGADGVIADEVRAEGAAIEFADMTMDLYDDFETYLTNEKFEFTDDDSIKFTDEGEEEVFDVVFETINGIEVMSLVSDEITLHFEKSTYDKMMEYAVVGAETLEKMQGFWLACGSGGEISDTVKMEGCAVEITDMIMDTYYYFELDRMDMVFEFIDNDTIQFHENGEDDIIDIIFETIDGIKVMTFSGGNTSIHYVKSNYEEMMTYADMGVEGIISIDDELTDADLEYWISDIDWYYGLYVYADGSYEIAQDYDKYRFNSSDYTGVHEYSDGTEQITWYVLDGNLYATFPSGTYYWIVDFEYDGTDAYLYLLDSREGHEGCTWVYMTTPIS